MVPELGRTLLVPELGRVLLVLVGRELMVGRLETVGRELVAEGREVVAEGRAVVVEVRPETPAPAVLGVVA